MFAKSLTELDWATEYKKTNTVMEGFNKADECPSRKFRTFSAG